MEKGFENFEAIFGKLKAEWENNSPNQPPLLPFLFHVHALDAKHLRIHVTDFQSYTWESVKSLDQLEDLRDDAGIGGSSNEFINYLMDSIKSESLKLVLGGSRVTESGAKFAKLLAQKSKGMPIVTIYLDRLTNSCASDAITNVCWEIFKAFETGKEIAVKEQKRSYELTARLSAEKEKNETIQSQLDFALSSRKRKLSNVTDSYKRSPIPPTSLIDLDEMPISAAHGSLEMKLENYKKPSSVQSLVGVIAIPSFLFFFFVFFFF
ncbi:hypothetical protein ACHQM5_022894 [Ranunculus cassubicifolius]